MTAIADAPCAPMILHLTPAAPRDWRDEALCSQVDPESVLPGERRVDEGTQDGVPGLPCPRGVPGLRP